MRKWVLLLAVAAPLVAANIRTVTLREAVDLALKQNPDLLLARLDQQKADEAVRLARDPFFPKVVAGSGLAYSNGLPMSIEGSTPSIVQVQAVGSVFNRPQSYHIASAKEARRGAALDTGAKQDEVIYRTAALFLDAARAAKAAETAGKEADALSSVLEAVRARVAEGRELPIEQRRAELNLARARYRSQVLETNLRQARSALAQALGLDPEEEVRTAAAEAQQFPAPASADAAVEQALESSKEIRSLESKLLAKGYDIRAARAAKWPRLDLVGQYAVLARYNNYAEFFNRFQRHNGQIGVSVQIPLWQGPGYRGAVSQAETEAAQLQIQIRSARARIAADARAAFDAVAQAGAARDLARLDLDVAREQTSVLLAQSGEGRAALRQVEEARVAEIDKWIAFYDADANVEKAQLNLLRTTGTLFAALH